MRKIKIGQIGIGHNHAEAKMLAVRKFPDLFEVVGYAETNDEWIKSRGGIVAYQGLVRYEVDELIDKCDAILVETDVWNLTEIAKKCVLAGKHIHLDKPASANLEDFKSMIDIAEVKNLVVQLGYMYRYNPAIQKAISLVKSGDLGEIYSINAEMSTCHSAQYRKWLKNFKGGIMYILGSHMVDLIVYLLGEPKSISAFLKKTNQDGIDVEDNNFVVLEYDKTIARIYVSSVEVNGFGRRQFVVSGSGGTIDIKPIESPCIINYSDKKSIDNIYMDDKVTEVLQDDLAYGRYDEMMKDFYEYVVGNKENPYSYEHDYLVQKVLMQIVNNK
ncbi:MAG: Gfo/Idh/MocA family oxidoreductase [Clostridiales bacterium]|nr:Gfo/Idh/MocA family oxidoreductase [Clostridiales bacterium]